MLQVKLPQNIDLKVKGNPWIVKKIGKKLRLMEKNDETTHDTFVCSSWYFLRFCSPQEDKYGFKQDDIDYWM